MGLAWKERNSSVAVKLTGKRKWKKEKGKSEVKSEKLKVGRKINQINLRA